MKTSQAGENVFPRGTVSVDFNRTKTRVLRRTDAQALRAARDDKGLKVGETDSEMVSFFGGHQKIRQLDVYKDNVGVCDSQCDEDAWIWSADYDWIGQERCARRNILGFCVETEETGYPTSEFCRHCFEIVKILDVFEANSEGVEHAVAPLFVKYSKFS